MLNREAKVQALFSETGRDWNVNMVNEIFWPNEVATILSLPISQRNEEDKMVWGLTPKGTFTVSSAYKAILQHKQSNQGAISAREVAGNKWKEIWALPAQRKVKTLHMACLSTLPSHEKQSF